MFDGLTIDSIAARAVLVPMPRPLRTAAGDVPAAPGLGLEWDEKAVDKYAFR
jgi:L-alanine-DL-glutamate epimerase-like enolase superfamily enzyme